MFRRRALAILALALALPAASLYADKETFVLDKNHTEIGFKVRHFVSKVGGRFAKFEGTIALDRNKPEDSSVDVKIDAASIDTANPNRDKHLNSPDFFDTAKFPEITFKSTKIAANAKDKYNVTGDFTMHGVTKEITVPVTYTGSMKDPRGTERAGFELTTTLNRQDYGVKFNKTMDNGSLMLSDDVQVTILIESVKKGPEAAK